MANTDTSKIDPRVSKSIVEFLIENNRRINTEAEALAEMATMNNYSLLEAYLGWQGIMGYTDQIMNAVRSIDKACE